MHRKLTFTLGAVALASVATVGPFGSPAEATVFAENGLIAFDRNQGEAVYAIEPDGTNEVKIRDDTCCPEFSPDGRRLAVPRLNIDGLGWGATVRPDGTDYEPFAVDHPTLITGGGPWSPDGQWFVAEAFWQAFDEPAGMWIYRTDGSEVRQLLPFGLPGDWSPDGTQIVFVHDDAEQSGPGNAVFIVNADGTGMRRVTPWGMSGCCTASWSPDAQWILFDARGKIFVVHPDGAGLRQIHLEIDGRYWAYEPVWSPDGSKIAFSAWVRALGQDDIYMADADGTNVLQVTNTPDQEGQVDWGAAVP